MGTQIKVGHWEADGGLVNIPLGFVPNHIRIVQFDSNTNIMVYEWFKAQESNEASGSQEGISYAEGVTANLADAGGITAYNTGTEGPTVTSWTTSVSTAATAKTATAPGTYVKPAVSTSLNAADRSAIFECVTAGTGSATEPTWATVEIGGQILDGSTVWERVNTPTGREGYQGVVVAAGIQTDGDECYYVATLSHDDVDHGDVNGWTSGIEPL